MTRGARVASNVLGVAALALSFTPVLYIVYASLVPERALFAGHAGGLGAFSLAHYWSLFEQRGFAVPLRNSLVVAGVTTLCCVVLAACSAYALARLEFRGKLWLSGLFLATSTFPQISIVEPLYSVLRGLGLINTYPGLVLPYLTFALPLSVFLLVSFFQQLPPEIEQAAMLDGAGPLGVFWYVVLPLSMPGVVSTAIISFVYCWNEFLFALSFSVGPDRQTVPVALALLRGRHQIPWGEVFAAAVVAILPVVALVLFFQRRIVQGLATSAGSKG